MSSKTVKTSDSLNANSLKKLMSSDFLGKTLFSGKVKGFLAKRTKTGVAFRIRYVNDLGKFSEFTFGSYPAMKFGVAEQAATELLAKTRLGHDPLKEKRTRRKTAKAESEQEAQRRLGNYLDGLYARHQARKKSGQETLRVIRHNFAEWLDRDMTTLAGADIKKWQLKREKQIKFTTIQRAYGALKTMLNRAIEDGIVDKNPLPIKSPLERPHHEETENAIQGRDERRLLTDSEVRAFFDGLQAFGDDIKRQRRNSIKHGRKYLPSLEDTENPHWFIPFAKLAYFTGLRTGDLYGLQWNELNLTFKRLTRIPEKTRHHSNPAKVVLDLPDEIVEVMKSWHTEQGALENGLVFPSPVTGGRMDKKGHDKAWKRVKQLGGLPEKLAFYSLRHHWISRLVASGLPLFTVARMAGHKSVQMIESNYGHLSPDATKNALDIFNTANQIDEKGAVNE